MGSPFITPSRSNYLPKAPAFTYHQIGKKGFNIWILGDTNIQAFPSA